MHTVLFMLIYAINVKFIETIITEIEKEISTVIFLYIKQAILHCVNSINLELIVTLARNSNYEKCRKKLFEGKSKIKVPFLGK